MSGKLANGLKLINTVTFTFNGTTSIIAMTRNITDRSAKVYLFEFVHNVTVANATEYSFIYIYHLNSYIQSVNILDNRYAFTRLPVNISGSSYSLFDVYQRSSIQMMSLSQLSQVNDWEYRYVVYNGVTVAQAYNSQATTTNGTVTMNLYILL